jgi:hypothetical protein
MQQAKTLATHRASLTPAHRSTAGPSVPEALPDGPDPLAVDVRELGLCRPSPTVVRRCEEADFAEGHEDPQQSEELERQQDA